MHKSPTFTSRGFVIDNLTHSSVPLYQVPVRYENSMKNQWFIKPITEYFSYICKSYQTETDYA